MSKTSADISLSGGNWQSIDAFREVQRLYVGSFAFHGALRAYDRSLTTNVFEEALSFEVIKENAGDLFATWKAKIFSDPSITVTPSKINAYVSDIELSADISLVLWLEPIEQRRLFQVKYTPLPVVDEIWTIGLDSQTMVLSNAEARLKWEAPDKDPLLLAETVKEAETKAQSGEFAAAYKLIFRRVDRVMKAGALDEIDSVLSKISAEDMTLETLIALLTATLPVRTRLPARKAFFLATEKVAKDRNRWTQSLLSGLEG